MLLITMDRNFNITANPGYYFTFASFVTLLYLYLIILQKWMSKPDDRLYIMDLTWSIMAVTIFDFGLGTLLAVAANKTGYRCKRRMALWILLETIMIPIAIFLLMRLYYRLKKTEMNLPTDTHFLRICTVQICFLLGHFFFIGYAFDFMSTSKPKIKLYDPSIRPVTVHEPTDPQITTTESRHIRMCNSFFSQDTRAHTPQRKSTSDSERPSTSASS